VGGLYLVGYDAARFGVYLELEVQVLLAEPPLLDGHVSFHLPDVPLGAGGVPRLSEGDVLDLVRSELGDKVPPGGGLSAASVLNPDPGQIPDRESFGAPDI